VYSITKEGKCKGINYFIYFTISTKIKDGFGLLSYNLAVINLLFFFMSKHNQTTYHAKATQSVFLAAGALMVGTFPHLFKYFNLSGLLFLFVVVAVAVLAGFTSSRNGLVLKLNVLVAIFGFVISMYRAINIFFAGVEEPITVFSFWTYQILSLIFFFAIYFSVRAARS
jgi:hypothetical protein